MFETVNLAKKKKPKYIQSIPQNSLTVQDS